MVYFSELFTLCPLYKKKVGEKKRNWIIFKSSEKKDRATKIGAAAILMRNVKKGDIKQVTHKPPLFWS